MQGTATRTSTAGGVPPLQHVRPDESDPPRDDGQRDEARAAPLSRLKSHGRFDDLRAVSGPSFVPELQPEEEEKKMEKDGKNEDVKSLSSSLHGTAVEATELKFSTSTRKEWFGSAVRIFLRGAPGAPAFDRDLREVMEPHVAKARLRRDEEDRRRRRRRSTDGSCDTGEGGETGAHLSTASSVGDVAGVPYPTLRSERPFLYDVETHPLHHALADALGWPSEDLSNLHRHPAARDKSDLLAPLLDRDRRRPFHECYDAFVTSFCIPLLHSLAIERGIFHVGGGGASAVGLAPSQVVAGRRLVPPHHRRRVVYRYQAFPCVRVVRPGDFSIGPHCDVAYGHSCANLNFHVPLTPTFGTNALYAERHPGREDWHPLAAKSVGLGYLFDGARCLHFSLENATESTRVSLDFRIAISRGDGCGHDDEDDLTATIGQVEQLCGRETLRDRFSEAGPGYYEEVEVELGGEPSPHLPPGPVVFRKIQDKERVLFANPDKRVGFPFR